MRDWIADWNRWSPAERVLAVVVATILAAVPLSMVLVGKVGV